MVEPSDTNGSFVAIMQPYMPVFYVAFVVTLVMTPLMRVLAHRHGIVDNPDGKRKVHTQPIAYLGGVATFLGWLGGVCVSVVLPIHKTVGGPQMMSAPLPVPPGVLMGAAVVVLFGLMDDVYSIRPRVKLFGQFLAACCLIIPGKLGLGADFFLGEGRGLAWMILEPLNRHRILNFADMNPNTLGYITMGAMLCSGVAAIFIIISTCNATNLLDGLDGLCSGVTGVMSVGYLVLAVYLASISAGLPDLNVAAVDPTRLTLSLALLGAVLGFLPYNFNPASIFMGDTGSMFLGYMCGTMMLLFGQGGTVRWFLGAVVIFGLPLLDTLLAIVRRKLNGQPIFSPDANHFHHFLIKRGFSVRQAVLLSYGLAAVFVSFALVIVFIQTRLALGLYLVLFSWLVVAAFKMGMIFQQRPPGSSGPPGPTNSTLNMAVIGVRTETSVPTVVEPAGQTIELQTVAGR